MEQPVVVSKGRGKEIRLVALQAASVHEAVVTEAAQEVPRISEINQPWQSPQGWKFQFNFEVRYNLDSHPHCKLHFRAKRRLRHGISTFV